MDICSDIFSSRLHVFYINMDESETKLILLEKNYFKTLKNAENSLNFELLKESKAILNAE